MWEQSKYFEDFENAANYVNGRFDPAAAEALRAREAGQAGNGAGTDLDGQVRTIAQRHRPQQKT